MSSARDLVFFFFFSFLRARANRTLRENDITVVIQLLLSPAFAADNAHIGVFSAASRANLPLNFLPRFLEQSAHFSTASESVAAEFFKLLTNARISDADVI